MKTQLPSKYLWISSRESQVENHWTTANCSNCRWIWSKN